MRSILLHVGDDASVEARLQAALDVCRAFDAHLTCLQATPIEILVSGDPYGGFYATTALIDAFRTRGEEQRAELQRRLAGEDVRWDWVQLDQDPALSVVEYGSLADLVVLGLPDAESTPKARGLVSDVAVTGRAPVLAVPQDLRALDCEGSAVVAWNGSMEAGHALRSAVPLLARASAVRIVTVTDDTDRLPATQAAEYLSRHGIGCELRNWPRDGRRVSEALLDAARSLEAAYLVAGAYGHTRFREAVLGGVTRELIEQARLPLLLSH